MNVYDEMNKLCEGIKETHEFTKIQEAKRNYPPIKTQKPWSRISCSKVPT